MHTKHLEYYEKQEFYRVSNNDSNNKYISRALNPSVSNLPEAQSAVHVQLQLSKQRNQRRQKTTTNKPTKAGDGRVKGQDSNIK